MSTRKQKSMDDAWARRILAKKPTSSFRIGSKFSQKLSAHQIEKLARIINENFSSPFLEDGMVEAEAFDEGLRIRIGPRTIDIDFNLDLVGSDTDLDTESSPPKKFSRKRNYHHGFFDGDSEDDD